MTNEAKWGEDVFSLWSKAPKHSESQQVQETPPAENAGAATEAKEVKPEVKDNIAQNSQEEHSGLGGETPSGGSGSDDKPKEESKDGGEPSGGEPSAEGQDQGYTQNFTLEGDSGKSGDSSLQKPENQTQDLLKELSSKLGRDFESVDNVVEYIGSAKKGKQEKTVIPGLPEDVSDMVLSGEIALEEVANGSLLYDPTSIPDKDVYLDYLVRDLKMSQEEAVEFIEDLSEREIMLKGRELKMRMADNREKAIASLKSTNAERKAKEAEAAAARAAQDAADLKAYKATVEKNLLGEVKLQATGQELSDTDKRTVSRILTEDGLLRQLIWGKANPSEADIPTAIQNVAMLVKRGDVVKRLTEMGANQVRKEFIDKAKNINTGGNSSIPVGQSQNGGPTWKKNLDSF
ncbi:hypothetical protein [uncultured Sphaerochaeta sp.]|uniref:hypothetical protein n=1 Tax=uncultured Sphaerochaeta sp. TaxID=886478 RepID=UPI00262387E3|nr:hypothetical protein [uncultured Sphaerochaeta sp.]